MSKKGFLFGLAVGASAIAAVATKLSDEKKAELAAKAQAGLAAFKDRAIDYAFYANDATADFRDVASEEFEEAKRKVADFAEQYQATKGAGDETFTSSLDRATDSLRTELAQVEDEQDADDDEGDIVIDGSAAFSDATSAASEADSATSAADSAADSATTDSEA
ncbi:YtxH domain-containing protein [Lactiplantibacillus modestisalitolerans]|uniref:YtxH domain-containing protein n=1 Tax=Lactiplantibacillus modestisalitolerans TaxID=1457219 RepID=A0ABV5WVH2_9LACO|nr:YtxH domain-containing protein [Lactiplantibacillus modestisalitolerans]